jgi:hypothetical protein
LIGCTVWIKMRWPAGKRGIQQARIVKVEAGDVAQSAFRIGEQAQAAGLGR